jgi:hypothetical protein
MTSGLEVMLRYVLAALLTMATYSLGEALHLGWWTDGTAVAAMLALAVLAYRSCRQADQLTDRAEEARLTAPLPPVERTEVFWVQLADALAAEHGPTTVPPMLIEWVDVPDPIEREAVEATERAPFAEMFDRWDRAAQELHRQWSDALVEVCGSVRTGTASHSNDAELLAHAVGAR